MAKRTSDSDTAVVDAPFEDLPFVAPRVRDYEQWEAMSIDSGVALKLRHFLMLDEDEPIPGSILKTLTDMAAEPSWDSLWSDMTDATLKVVIQIAELKYPSGPQNFQPNTTVHSTQFNCDVIYVRPAAVGRALINRHGNFHAVPLSDLL